MTTHRRSRCKFQFIDVESFHFLRHDFVDRRATAARGDDSADRKTRRQNGRIVALGTTVTRALESAFAETEIQRRGMTSLKLNGASRLRVVDTLITGMHEAGTSHSELMQAFCHCDLIEQAGHEADRLDYRSHEYGDLALLDCKGPKKMSK